MGSGGATEAAGMRNTWQTDEAFDVGWHLAQRHAVRLSRPGPLDLKAEGFTVQFEDRELLLITTARWLSSSQLTVQHEQGGDRCPKVRPARIPSDSPRWLLWERIRQGPMYVS
jgi:hypothetical protein